MNVSDLPYDMTWSQGVKLGKKETNNFDIYFEIARKAKYEPFRNQNILVKGNMICRISISPLHCTIYVLFGGLNKNAL